MKSINTGAQFVLLVVGLFSGYLKAVAPVSDDSLQIVPGGIASFAALILLLLARAIAKALPSAKVRRIYWLALAVAASLPAIGFILYYADLWQQGTVEVPVTIENGKVDVERRVKGTVLTERADRYAEIKGFKGHPDDHDEDLIGALGGIRAVWTRQSIHDQWWRLNRFYVLSVAGTVLALSFLAQALSPTRDVSTSRSARRRRKPRPKKEVSATG